MFNIFGKHLRITIKTNNISLLLWVITCFLCVLPISQYGRLKVSILKILRIFHMVLRIVLIRQLLLSVFLRNKKVGFCGFLSFGD